MKKSALHLSLSCAALLSLAIAPRVEAQPWKLIGITGQQSNEELAGDGSFLYPDNTLYEINQASAAITKLFRATWIPDSHAIGYNPDSGLLFHSGGANAYRDDPNRTAHDQGGDPIAGVAFQDNYYVETINLFNGVATGVINNNPCPNPDPLLPCFGLPAPRPTWALPTERRTSDQTANSFRQRGENEYSALRGFAWSAEKKLFYVTDGEGIFKLTTTGDSTFLARPAFPIDNAQDEAKGIAFVVTTNLFVGHRNGALDPSNPESHKDGYLMRLNPDTGEVIGQVRLRFPEGGGEPVDSFGGLLGLSQHPGTGVLYGVRQTDGVFDRELVTIDPQTGETKLIGNMHMHVASIAFAQSGPGTPWKLIGITGQQSNTDDLAGDGSFLYPDNTLYEINIATAALTKLFRATWIPDSHAIGYNPESGLLFHSGGANAYRDDPNRTAHDQGGEPIAGVAFQDNYYIETINLANNQAAGVINANPCPNPDPLLPCFGLVAPRPTWALPTERRTSDQTANSFRQRGENEYSALRGFAWSAEKKVFYVTDGEGIFKITPTGDSTFLARPAFPIDGKQDEAKAIAFVVTTNLVVAHRNGAVDPNEVDGVKDGYLMQLNPETGEVTGQLRVRYPVGGGEPVGAFGGIVGLSQHPETGVLYGVRQMPDDAFTRELVTINPNTGESKLVGNLGMHIAGIAFAQAKSTDLTLTVTAQTAGTVTFSWTGGSGKFLLQKKADIGAANWINVLTTTERTATVSKDGLAAFFRVQSDYTGADVMPLSAFLTGDAEKPTAVTTAASGVGTLSLQGNTVNYLITYNGLSSTPSAAHIHGSATVDSTTAAGVMVGFPTPVGTTGYIAGTLALTDDQKNNVLAGRSYVNIHTANFGGGEIRGNILRTTYSATLNGANERPTPVTTAATGAATINIIGNELTYNVNWTGLSGTATAGHIHGRADATTSAGVIQGFTGVTGATGGTTGRVVVGQNVLGAILDGKAYVNIHTAANGGGEIRGQLAP